MIVGIVGAEAAKFTEETAACAKKVIEAILGRTDVTGYSSGHCHLGGMKFEKCYHCNSTSHVKSGGCWTGKYAERLGKKAVWHVIG